MFSARKRSLGLVLAIATVPATALCDDSAARGSAILSQAHQLAEASVAQPLEQSGHVVVLTGPKRIEGTYEYLASGSQWRDEISLPGYREVRVRAGTEEKIERPMPYSPLAIYAMFDSVRRITSLQVLPGERIKRVKNEKVLKVPVKCVELEGKLGARTVCVYDDGALAAVHTSTGWSYEYSEYSTFEKARLPGRIRVTEDGSAVVEILLDSPKALPSGAEFRIGRPTATLGWCPQMVPAVIDNKVQPRYPQIARQTHTQGTVDVAGIVQPDGSVKLLGVVRSTGSALDQATTDAVAQWRYRPASCDGTPVPTETVVNVHYTLSP